MGHKHFCPGGAVSGGTVAQERRPLRHITIFDRDPAAKDRSLGVPKREALLGDDRNQLVYPLAEDCVVSHQRQHRGAIRQARGQRRRMSQAPSLSDCRVALCQCLVGKAETENDCPQIRLRDHLGVDSGLIDKRAVGIWIVKRKHLFQMRSRWSKPAANKQVSTG